MRRFKVAVVMMALGIAVSAGHAMAGGVASDTSGGQEIGTVRFVDRALNLVQLDNGTELRASDPRMLTNIREGMHVTVDFSEDNGTHTLNSISPAATN
jgi:hypothetical protein